MANFYRRLRYNNFLYLVFKICFTVFTSIILYFSSCYSTFRGHPKVRRLDMMHATDYSNMGFDQMNKKVADAKKLDKFISNSIEWVPFKLLHFSNSNMFIWINVIEKNWFPIISIFSEKKQLRGKRERVRNSCHIIVKLVDIITFCLLQIQIISIYYLFAEEAEKEGSPEAHFEGSDDEKPRKKSCQDSNGNFILWLIEWNDMVWEYFVS